MARNFAVRARADAVVSKERGSFFPMKSFPAKHDTIQAGMFDIRENREIFHEIKFIVNMMQPDFDFGHFDAAFRDVERLFRGQYAGYRSCNTRYHDFGHTLMVLLAMTRLLHGAYFSGVQFTDKHINLGLICPLMHDIGYIQKTDDREGTGAKYTLTHVSRSIDFMQKYYSSNPYFAPDAKNFHVILNCTGLHTNIGELCFESEEIALLGKMMGTSDLLGQMADRLYLEKLLFLYNEFVEGEVSGFDSEEDLYRKTIGFYKWTKERLENQFGNVGNYMTVHFKNRWNIDRNLYEEAIENNINYLDLILRNNGNNIHSGLRRKIFYF